MPILNQKLFDSIVAGNTDKFGKTCVDCAREVMRLLDDPGYEFSDTRDVLKDASVQGEFLEITGYQAYWIVKIVYNCHSRGGELRQKFISLYNQNGF